MLLNSLGAHIGALGLLLVCGCNARTAEHVASTGSLGSGPDLTGAPVDSSEIVSSSESIQAMSGTSYGSTPATSHVSSDSAPSAVDAAVAGNDEGCERKLARADEDSVAAAKLTSELQEHFATGQEAQVLVTTNNAPDGYCANVWLASQGAAVYFFDEERTILVTRISAEEADGLSKLVIVERIELAHLNTPPPAPPP